MNTQQQFATSRLRRSQTGFSLMEVMIAMVVLTIGLVGLLSVFGFAVASTQSAQQDLIAKQLASEAMESIFTARNTNQLSWASIQNVSNGGIFLDGYQSIMEPGGDGIIGTADDGPAKVLSLPGPDGIVGTGDDSTQPLTNYKRQIQLTPVPGNVSLQTVTITVQYTVPPRIQKSYVLTGYISQFR